MFLTVDKKDYFISFAVCIQPFLIILQQNMISVLGMETEATTIYRVLLSAAFMLVAIIFSFFRRKVLFVLVYLVAFVVLMLNYLFYPETSEYVIYEAFRFLLPMVIPSALCLLTVRSIEIVEKALYHVSWLTCGLVVLYFVKYLQGAFLYESYNMSFSYACLLPMVALYRHKSKLSLLASFFIFLVVVAIGSRGAAIIFVAYVLYDLVLFNVKYAIFFVSFALLFVASIPFFVDWLDSIGVGSRTLSMSLNGELANDTGRDNLYQKMFLALDERPLGLGLYGDRVILGIYCHNIFLEMLVNYGYPGVMILFSAFLVFLFRLYIKLDKLNKSRFIAYTLVFIGPLMASGSYLSEPNFGIYCGMLYLLNKFDSIELRNAFKF